VFVEFDQTGMLDAGLFETDRLAASARAQLESGEAR
jgi:hypothetical protein